jgi:hypothetical protein
MSMAFRTNYSDFFGADSLPVLEEIVESNYEMHPSRREMFFKTVSTDRDIWQSTEMHDMPLFSEVPEGTDYSYNRPMQGASKTLTVVKYGSGFSVTEECVADGKFGFLASAAENLGRSARESQEISAMNIFNNGFSSETTADGVALFSASHTLPRGGTYRNVLSTASDPSPSSLEQMLIDYETQQVTDNGIILSIKPKGIWCHPSQRRYFEELVGSSQKPDSSDNNLNSLKSDGLIVVSSPHLTDSDAWGLFGDKDQMGLRIVKREGFSTKQAGDQVGFHNDTIYVKAKYREKLGAIHARALFGTGGA